MNFIKKSRKIFLLIWISSLFIGNNSEIVSTMERALSSIQSKNEVLSRNRNIEGLNSESKISKKNVSSTKKSSKTVKIKEKSNQFNAIIESDEIQYTYGERASWSSCKPIKYLISTGTTEIEEASINEALAIIGELKGLKFEFAGRRDTVASQDWGRKLENNDYRPVLISFTTPSKTDMLGGSNAGATVVNRSGENLNLFVSGSVAINRNAYAGLDEGFGAGMSQGNLLLHEFGHLVGLGHVDIDSALMNPTISTRTDKGFSEKATLSISSNKARCEKK